MTETLSPQDIGDIKARGLATEEVLRQASFLEKPPPRPVLARPCRVGDGILSLKPEEASPLIAVFDRARREGRLMRFVPASGAATRMFKPLLAWRASHPNFSIEELSGAAASSPDAAETLKFVRNLRHFPFFEALREALTRKGQDPAALLQKEAFGPWLDALLAEDGLRLDSLPKGIIPFHRSKTGVKTPFEEHILESAEVLRDQENVSRLHFTVSPEHEAHFRRLSSEVLPRLEQTRRCRFSVVFSPQNPSTDTVALDGGRLARTPAGRLLFRPGGHGSLLDNLNALKGDLVFIKNIDNVPHESHPGESAHWDALLAGLLADLQSHIFQRLSWLATRPQDPRILAEAEHFAARRLNILRAISSPEEDEAVGHKRRREWLTARLSRPLRVCAVVKNTNETGGAPFWVRASDGTLSPQIIESSQVSDQPDQGRIFRAATHFNPVHMALSLKGWRGDTFDLRRFTDPEAMLITEKVVGGRPLRALERPGLWNGAMANWTTVFVETPLSTFHPVKTVNDLLRADHQPSQ